MIPYILLVDDFGKHHLAIVRSEVWNPSLTQKQSYLQGRNHSLIHSTICLTCILIWSCSTFFN
jgi:hypothetical protein